MTASDGLQFDRLDLGQGDFSLTADFTMSPGGLVALIGPSGAGKSTLLSAIAGFLEPRRGLIRWHGQDITRLAPAQRPVSILFQDNNLFPHLPVWKNLGLALDPRLKLSEADRSRIDEILDRLGLAGMGDRQPGALSGGQASRAALGRVLLADRPLVLLDEPFSALGPGLRQDMLHLAARMMEEAGRTAILVTHDPDDARLVAQRTMLVMDGIVHPPIGTDALFADPPDGLRQYLGHSGDMSRR
ncbi:ATP-binding cassette domain-containing protein [Ponticoccus sp. SC2-23]|uniref:thiamine ABC transporter ATP-binding protein n=1 Tax=Alexandriicola marinus TaxID=2081710 RepID=UPI000FD97449|nr:ATP-binding cassette domain-containing protein [Alexandriicola marinus]MBM1220599.1 ATP-binding cassette domain-containing protein [Ponticoccus sp. SC6-9]MBM1225285.1 ATP-binding cassette domain-containing protein [Ponticoccus sp. SC6-15]MBM1228799.1 ATP-binding cassette domain-containing protein [Ponticoccus sp. SC6-38]MBM1233564.1 ATP-binding cassette domain-containing protein [Ponticoccus sp. SC6-45]MBM1239300.1 ATP-binding cassette domain-containing protein [Ponticoccus sp. SC6-49]MBM1